MAGVRSTRTMLLVVVGVVAVLGLWNLGLKGAGKVNSVGVRVGGERWYTSGAFFEQFLNNTDDLGLETSQAQAHATQLQLQRLGYNAVLLYLLVNTSQLRQLLLSLSYLHTNVPLVHPWPILLLHTDELENESTRMEFTLRLYDFLGGGPEARAFIDRIEWVKLTLHLPKHLSEDKSVVEPNFADYWPEYHKTNEFFSTQIFLERRLRDVDYYMRLDADAYFYTPLCYDPIDLFHAHNRSYAYASTLSSSSSSSSPTKLSSAKRHAMKEIPVGLWSLVDEYARLHPEVAEILKKNGWAWPQEEDDDSDSGSGSEVGLHGGINQVGLGGFGREYGMHDAPPDESSFEIVKIAPFRRKQVRAWFEEIKRFPERLYKYGWRDAAIRYATVNMFFDIKTDVEEYCGLDYWHNGVRRRGCACEEQIQADEDSK